MVESVRASLPMLRFWESEDRLSVGALIVANLVPLAGVFLLGWDAGALVFLYWTENVVIGFYNVLKMAAARGTEPNGAPKLFIIPFFCVHYGIFCLVHGGFVVVFAHVSRWGFHGDPFGDPVGQFLVPMIWPISCLVVSHGISFVQNTIRGREYKTMTPGRLFAAPYARVLVLHLALLAAGIFVVLLGSSIPLLVLLIAGKIVLDLHLHERSHRQRADQAPEEHQEGAMA